MLQQFLLLLFIQLLFANMNRPRTASQCATIRHGTKRHCPEDLKCEGCCSCVQQYKNMNSILKEKLERLIRDNQEYEKTLAKMNKKVADYQKRKEEFDKIDEFKLKVRQTITKQLQQQNKAEQFILEERIDNAKKDKKQLQQTIDQLQRDNHQKQRSIDHFKHQLLTLNDKVSVLQKQLQRKDKYGQQSEAKVTDLRAKILNLESMIEDKTQIITRMQSALGQSQQNFIAEKTKARNSEFQCLRHQQELKMKAFQISSLQKTTQQNSNSINNLAADKQKLGKLVAELDSTVHSYSQLSNQLRERIYASEDYALQKEIQYKQLEADYYHTIYQQYP